jgi:hypothetical protein
MLILKRISFPLSLRQQRPSGSNLAFLNARVSLCCVVVGYVSRSVAVHVNICSKLVRNTTLSEHFKFFAWFPNLVRPNLSVRKAARTHFRHNSLTINLYFAPPPVTSQVWAYCILSNGGKQGLMIICRLFRMKRCCHPQDSEQNLRISE